MASDPKLIKVCLTNQGEDTEKPWAQDLGPAPGITGARKVRLVNVPFMHAKPTWGDTIVVLPAKELLTWDRSGVKWSEIGTRIVEDGGRWAMIVDYQPHDGVAAPDALAAIARACDGQQIVCENARAASDGTPGRAYLAVPREATVEVVMQRLEAAGLPAHLHLVHPEPRKPQRASTVVGVTAVQPRRPARAKTEKPIEAELETAPRPRATTEPAAEAAPAAKKPGRAKTAPAAAEEAAPAKPTAPKPAPAKGAKAPAKAAPAKAAAKAPAKAVPAAAKAPPPKPAARPAAKAASAKAPPPKPAKAAARAPAKKAAPAKKR